MRNGNIVRHVAYAVVQATWGFPQTCAGLGVFLVHARKPHFPFHGARVTLWGRNASMSLGPFLFLEGEPANYADPEATEPTWYGQLLVHEYGHSIQSLILGPLYLPLIGLPSIIWLNAAALKRRRRERETSYYAFWPERSANWLGERALKLPSIGQARID